MEAPLEEREGSLRATAGPPFGLYVHVPYCLYKCPYCDFNVRVAREIPEERYTAALVRELLRAADEDAWRGREIATVFIGGGTPSLFGAASVARLIERALASWPAAADLEVTLEANPDGLDVAALTGFRAAGVTRLSLGAQSFVPRHLVRLGRRHRPEDTTAAVRGARTAGFDNVNLDLIFACPGETPEEWELDLRAAVDLAPEHISTYALTYEERTMFHRLRARGALAAVSEEAEVAMLRRAADLLPREGYARYEISNYARPGRHSRHNSHIWRGAEYLGIGAGAHSFRRTGWGQRWSNLRSPQRYMEAVERDGEVRDFVERLSPEQAMGEWSFLGLRQMCGIDAQEFRERFGRDFESQFPSLPELRSGGLLARTKRGYRLTARGILLSDTVFTAFL